MSETYMIYMPNGLGIKVDKKTNDIQFAERRLQTGRYTKQYSKIVLKAHHIKQSSPYKSYKPIYLDPTLKTGASSTLLEFKAWQDLYLNDPPRGKIAPWTKKEKAYYESLKTKRERYKYLVIRSGLRSAVIDIPYEAYAGVDEDGKLINKDLAYLYEEVEKNRGLAHLSDGFLIMAEWELAAGILGDLRGFLSYDRLHGFKARLRQVEFLSLQLTGGMYEKNSIGMSYEFKHYAERSELGLDGIHKNQLRAMQIKEFAKNPPYDSFGMLPYLDEMIGVDWVFDMNTYNFAYDGRGLIPNVLYQDIKNGKLKDPRDKDSTPESRKEFDRQMSSYTGSNLYRYDADIPNEWSEDEAKLSMDVLLLEANLAALTPPQGYPNAPFYYTPERLESIYKNAKLDKRKNPTIPAIYKEHFPQYLRDEIEAYAKKHNVKD